MRNQLVRDLLLGIFKSEYLKITVHAGHGKMCFLLIFFALNAIQVVAQAPYQFNFQGVARDENGRIISNTTISVDVYIGSDDPIDPMFNETHTVNTNPAGVFNIAVGSITMAPLKTLQSLDWGSKSYYMQIFLSVDGADFIDLGKTRLLSVPYSLYSDQTGLAKSAETANEAEKWTNDIPIIQTGTANSPILPSIGTGNKLIWYPRKAAFRVGNVSGNQWENGQIGNNSFAAGLDALALGNASIALGRGTVAKAVGGIAVGSYNADDDNPGIQAALTDRIFQVGNGIDEQTGRLNALTILRNGNVGIGQTVFSPKYLLDVGGRVRIRQNGNQTAGIYFNKVSNEEEGFVGMKTDSEVGFFIGDNWRFWVNSGGTGFLNGAIVQTSDRRLKRDFSPLSNSLSKLSNLVGQHYFWKDTTQSQELQTGLIAQEVEQYFPELVTTDEKGFKAVNYIGLIPHLIESVKALKVKTDEITALQKSLESVKGLEKQIADLRAELKDGILKANTSTDITSSK